MLSDFSKETVSYKEKSVTKESHEPGIEESTQLTY